MTDNQTQQTTNDQTQQTTNDQTQQTTNDQTQQTTNDQTTVTDGKTGPDTATTSSEPTPPSNTERSTTARLRRLVDYLALAGLALLALVAGIQVYTAIDATIERFVVSEYQPLFRGVVNLALLLLAAGGVTLQLRRLQ